MTTSPEDTSSSEDYSPDSSESSDEDGMETALLNGFKLQLPQGLCERKDIFNEFFTVELWNSFSDKDKEHLQTFLPNFPDDDDTEKSITLQKLFEFENFRFSNPLNKFYQDLKAGFFRPGIARMRKFIHRAEKDEAMYRYRSYRKKVKHEVLESQEKLLNQIKYLPPGIEPKQEKIKVPNDILYHRTRKRYFQTLASINFKTDDMDMSSDENYPEGPPMHISRKQKRHLNNIKSSLNSSKERLFPSTMVAKLHKTPIDLEKHIINSNPFYVTDDSYKNMLHQHKRRKIEYPGDSELNTENISIVEVVARTQLPYIKNLQHKSPHQESKIHKKVIKKEPLPKPVEELQTSTIFNSTSFSVPENHSSAYSESDSDSMLDAVSVPKVPLSLPTPILNTSLLSKPIQNQNEKITKLSKSAIKKEVLSPPHIKVEEDIKLEPVDDVFEEPVAQSLIQTPINVTTSHFSQITTPMSSFTSYNRPTPIKVEDLEPIDIMNAPVELDNSDIDIVEFNIKPELMQETHANFFSLIRDIICSTSGHRMNMYTLQERLKAWQENPISPLNDWYSYVNNWLNILPSAITFLCGNASEQPEDFVPYMEYKSPLDVYQWIGAGRDSDQLLSNLCNFWMQHRTESKSLLPGELDVDFSGRDNTPPPPRCPTTWTVRKATLEEIKDYREQERRRYSNPHKAFTFRCNGYESVVGPLKGMYNPSVVNTKARGHTMLNANRPNFVTILSLVRDATARLPNGEGTRADICELLKSSQYISSTAPENILQSVVSGALDRMHTQWDPCVKYDQKRKIWIYLHRHRSEEDFERIHQHFKGVPKVGKNTRKSPAKPKTPKTEKRTKANKQENQKVVIPPEPPQLTTAVPSANGEELLKKKATEEPKPPRQIKIEDKKKASNVIVKEDIMEDAKLQKIPELQIPSCSVKTEVVATPSKAHTPVRRRNIPQNRIVTTKIDDNTVTLSLPNLVATNQKSASLLLSNNAPKPQPEQILESTQSLITKTEPPLLQVSSKDASSLQDQQPELVKISVTGALSTIKGAQGQMLKIVSPSQGKSVIIPTSDPQILKQIQERPSSSQSSHQFIVDSAIPSTQGIQIKPAGLSAAQTHQILQSIKQKYLPNANLLTPQQQVLLKQKGLVEIQKAASLQKNSTGYTLRLQSTKPGQQGIIHLTSTPKSNALGQFTFGTTNANSLIGLTAQRKVTPSQNTTIAATVLAKAPATRAVAPHRTQQMTTKTLPNVTQQLINAKIITSEGGQKIVQAKATGKTGERLTSLGGLRMVNAANLNLTTIDGKPVLLASKTGTIQNIHGQNVILQAHPSSTGSSLVLQGTVGKKTDVQDSQNISVLNQTGNIVFSPTTVKGQSQQLLFSSEGKNVTLAGSATSQGHIILGGQPIKLQTSNAGESQRVVLASQGQGGQILTQQILLPAGFQGTAINIKSLQEVKVISVPQGVGGTQKKKLAKVVRTPSDGDHSVSSQQSTSSIHSSESDIA